jgi:flagellar motility protein MotE (MotC chaperone)
MSRVPRILPLVAVAIGGVLSVKALAEADALPRMMAGARAFAEEVQSKPAKKAEDEAAAKEAKDAKTAKDAGAETATSAPVPAAATPAAQPLVCAPSAADLAKDAGLSPAELQVLQSLGARRTQLDAREQDIDTQLKLLAAAEAKLDAKLKGLTGLKADLQTLLGQTEQKESEEINRLVTVYGKMKPKDAAAVMVQLDDKVRLPVAGKLKEAALAAILSQMPPAEAKKLTESLAKRYDKVQELAQAATAPSPSPQEQAEAEVKAADAKAEAAANAKAAPAKRPARRPQARRAAPRAQKQAQAAPAPKPAA